MHRTAEAAIAGVQNYPNQQTVVAPDVAPAVVPHQSAELSIAEEFLLEDMDEDKTVNNNLGQQHHPFDDAGQKDDSTRIKLAQKLEALQYEPEHTIFGKMTGMRDADTDGFEEDGGDSTVCGIVAAMKQMGLDDSDDSGSESGDGMMNNKGDEIWEDSWPVSEGDWAPHGTKTMFMLDLLDNLPRLRLSDDHLKAFMWVMRECGTPNVPSFSALRAAQAKMTQEVGIATLPRTSALENRFHINQAFSLLKLDWANPLVRPSIQLYPEVTSRISEYWQSEKWLQEVPSCQLGPMWADWERAGHRHFFIHELSQLVDEAYFIPCRWLRVNGEDTAEGHRVLYDVECNEFVIEEHTTSQIPASSLRFNFPDLKARLGQIVFSDHSPAWSKTMPNPLRETAKGRPMFVLRLIVWGDDVSGNRSKSYNAHTNVYIANASLPHKHLSQEYFIRFASTSPHAGASEQFTALLDDMTEDHWEPAYDCVLNQEILFQIYPHVFPADNPQQAESTSVVGQKGKFNCRYDKMGGTEAERESDEGYHAHFIPGVPREPEQTRLTIIEQYRLACLGVKTTVENLQSNTGIKDKIAEHWISQLLAKAVAMQQERIYASDTYKKLKGTAKATMKADVSAEIQEKLMEWVYTQPSESYSKLPEDSPLRHCLRPGDHFNILLERDRLGINTHRDNPNESLHTFLIGNDKYIWNDTSKTWDKKKELEFAVRLQSSSLDGLTLAPLRAQYMTQYKNSLIGKHFKALQQVAVFHLNDKLCPPRLLALWKATGELGALLWYPEITNMEIYLADVQILIDNLLDAWADFDPRRILYKYKLHILVHLPEDIRRFGPTILYSTEVFECWNAIFRMCSVLSNHLAPSRDIALTLADMERFKHQVSGGWWLSKDGEYVQASSKIRDFLYTNKELQRRLGWSETMKLEAGSIKLVAKAKRTETPFATLHEAMQLADTREVLQMQEQNDLWVHGRHVISRSHDVCKPGSWVFFQANDKASAGRISAILSPSSRTVLASRSLVVIEPFLVANVKDTRLNMPILIRRDDKACIVGPKDVLFLFNAQHDCTFGQCQVATVRKQVTQYQQTFFRTENLVAHTNDSRYLVNMHALHNASRLREVLPRHLTAPRPLFEDRQLKHDEFAADLRQTGPTKRAEAAAKTKLTKEKNKEKRAREEHRDAEVDTSTVQ